jgi:WD40 repeat protein
MKQKSIFLLLFILSISHFTFAGGFAQIQDELSSAVSHPMNTPYGIVFTNSMTNAVYLTHNGITEELFSGPGCGMYLTLSSDKTKIGFKSISADAQQAPAVFDLNTRAILLLHDYVNQSGQVSFSANGEIAYSIGNDVMVRNGTNTRSINLGTYSNIVALSADGKFIAFSDDQNKIFILDVNSQRQQCITVSSKGFYAPLWSPTANRLCYSSLDDSLFVYDASNGQSYSLGEGSEPAWSSDGKALVFVRKEVEKYTLLNSDLYSASYDGNIIVQLTKTPDVFETEPSVSDGEIVFRSYNSNAIFGATLARSFGILQNISTVATIDRQALVPKLQKESSILSLEKISTPAVYFEMPYTNQVYDTPDWYNGSAACGPTSAIMVIAYYNLLPVWNVWCKYYPAYAHWSAYGNYVCEQYHFRQVDYVYSATDPNGKSSWGGYGFMWTGSNSPYSRIVQYYSNHGLTASRMDAPPLDTVISEVSNGHPYTLCNGLTTAGHIIVINGVSDKRGTLIVNDPYGNKNSGSYPSRDGKGVYYDWPGYNNGYQNLNTSWWGVAVRYSPPTVCDTIVDDLQFGKGFTLHNSAPASMSLWKDKKTGYGGHMWYVFTHRSDTCYAQWQPTLKEEGMYEVSAYVPYSTAKAARYKIVNARDTATVIVNQSQYDSSWVSLGTFPFAKGDSGYVRLGDGSDSVGQAIIFDAIRWTYQSPMAVDEISSQPLHFELSQNYPNPFNPSTRIQYSVSSSEKVTLKVYDVLGREIATLVNERKSPGMYEVQFDGSGLSSGMYFYRLQAGNFVDTKKFVLLK